MFPGGEISFGDAMRLEFAAENPKHWTMYTVFDVQPRARLQLSQDLSGPMLGVLAG